MNLKMKQVMVIDDSEGDQYLAQLAIEEHDPEIKILKAYDGKEALNMLCNTKEPPDIIFLDINMPVMNGHEFLSEYNKKSNKRSVVVMLTSSTQETDKNKALTYDCVKKYAIKPLDSESIKKILLNLNSNSKTAS